MVKRQGVEHICIVNVGVRRACGQLHVSAFLPLAVRTLGEPWGQSGRCVEETICAENRSPDLFHYYSDELQISIFFLTKHSV
jgi:hypothetical protein